MRQQVCVGTQDAGFKGGHYKHPLPEEIRSNYMKCWGDVALLSTQANGLIGLELYGLVEVE
ncbi:MAG TPA: hypothetical protein VF393_01645 [archaeon]